MKLVVCAIFDTAIQAFSRPFFVPHTGAAIRGFSDEVNGKVPDSTLKEHYSDFSLFELGVFNDADASFELFEAPKLLVSGKMVRVVVPAIGEQAA